VWSEATTPRFRFPSGVKVMTLKDGNQSAAFNWGNEWIAKISCTFKIKGGSMEDMETLHLPINLVVS